MADSGHGRRRVLTYVVFLKESQMGIFSRIKDAIFGHKTAAEQAPAAPAPAVDDTVVAAATPAA
ncbi:MAG: hypothetical protein KGJ30_21290, partial [Burkholderiales bacterium]|nr:hypothetical protein [Burkholderiales bacterium]